MLFTSYILFSLTCYAISAQQYPPLIPSQNLTQLLNHDSNDTTTFNHSYQVDTTHFKPGGPILFLQGAETTAPIGSSQGTGVTAVVIHDWAKKLGAMTVCLEHRFFGTSFPKDFVGDSPRDFESLTLDNVVQDAVAFVKHIKKSIPGSESSKVIVTGGKDFFLPVLSRKYVDTCTLRFLCWLAVHSVPYSRA
jgi:dipeptidyl-peptidase-2/lysosomal Pro-X carboxypeptidase